MPLKAETASLEKSRLFLTEESVLFLNGQENGAFLPRLVRGMDS